jgi:hypothetical protein
LSQPKDKLIEFVADMMKDGDEFEQFGHALRAFKENLEGLVRLLDGASARLVAAAYCATPPDDDPGGGMEAPGNSGIKPAA